MYIKFLTIIFVIGNLFSCRSNTQTDETQEGNLKNDSATTYPIKRFFIWDQTSTLKDVMQYFAKNRIEVQTNIKPEVLLNNHIPAWANLFCSRTKYISPKFIKLEDITITNPVLEFFDDTLASVSIWYPRTSYESIENLFEVYQQKYGSGYSEVVDKRDSLQQFQRNTYRNIQENIWVVFTNEKNHKPSPSEIEYSFEVYFSSKMFDECGKERKKEQEQQEKLQTEKQKKLMDNI